MKIFKRETNMNTNTAEVKNFEVEFDENLISLTYDDNDVTPSVKEAFRFNPGKLKWNKNNLLWESGSKQIVFKNVSKENLKAMENKSKIYIASVEDKHLKTAVTLPLPKQEKVNKLKMGL
jgi:hypothetical protein